MNEITVSGAGFAGVNANYHNDGVGLNGKPFYTDQTAWSYYIYWVGGTTSQWQIVYPSLGTLYFNTADTPFPPQHGWQVGTGTAPAPTLSGPETIPSPQAVSFVLHNPASTPTNASILTFRATFNHAVLNVSVGDFAVYGGSTASVSDVSQVNGSVYDVTVSGGDLATYSGIVGLDLSPTQDIEDSNGLALLDIEPAIDEAYLIDRTLLSFERFNPVSENTNADALVFRVSFAEDMQHVDSADFEVHGSSTASVVDVAAMSAQVYDVTVSGGDLAGFDGLVGLDLSGSQNIEDMESNSLLTAEPPVDETYQVDNTSPYAVSFMRQTPSSPDTNADTLVFKATFSEGVAGVDVSDFAVNGGTTATAAGVAVTDPAIYFITVSGGDLADFDGTVGLDLDGAQNITDLVGNPLAAGEPVTDQTYTLDNTAPVLLAFSRIGNPQTNNDLIMFQVTFSEVVLSVDISDFDIDGGTTAEIDGVYSTGADEFRIDVSGGDLDDYNGPVGINLSETQDITDLVGNALPDGEPAIDEVFVMDNVDPSVISFERYDPPTSPTSADTLVFRVTFDDGVQYVEAIDFAISGGSTATIQSVDAISASVYHVTVSGGDLATYNGTVGLDFSPFLEIWDLATNPLPAGEPAIDETYSVVNQVADNVGFYVPGNYRWYLKTGTADGWAGVISFGWGGAAELQPVVGDWDGDGVDTAAFYKPSQWRWYLKNDQNDGWAGTTTFQWGGNSEMIPIAGDWDGDGDDTVGFFKPADSEWYLKDDNTGGWTGFTKVIWGGAAGNIPIAGDWDGDGYDTIGFYVPSQNKWWLKNDLADGWTSVSSVNFGTIDPMDPVTGDWDGDGTATVGGYVPTKWSWFLKDDLVDGWSSVTRIRFGVTADYEVLAGDWQ